MKVVATYFKVQSQLFMKGLRKITKNLSQDISGPRFEPGSSLMRSRNANQTTATFGLVCSVDTR
jgi:hypothetical protein